MEAGRQKQNQPGGQPASERGVSRCAGHPVSEHPFLEALRRTAAGGRIPVIPDIKCFSPKEGDLMCGRDPVQYAKCLEAAGAPVLSVVTERESFHGSLEMLRSVTEAVRVPVLRKDFLESAEELRETVKAGASAVLLMYSCLGKEKLEALYHEAAALGLLPFVETHTAEHLRWAAELGAPLIGINNRDILILERDDGTVEHAAGLLPAVPEGAFCIVESGLRSGADVRRAVRGGAGGVLVGTALLKAEDPAAACRAMSRPCDLKVCGIMNERDAALCLSMGADLLGFVTEYPAEVPWNLTKERAAELIREVRGRMGPSGPFARTCMVTGGAPEKIVERALFVRPDYVQLHYKETLEETARVASALLNEGIRVIRSVPPDVEARRAMFGTEKLPEIEKALAEAGVETLLLDSRTGDNAARGGGEILQLQGAEDSGAERQGEAPPERAFSERRMTLAVGGGITAENVRDVTARYRPDIIDVMTGVETAPGHKSEELLRRLTEAMQ